MQKLVWVPFFTSKALDNTAWHVAVQTDSQLRRSWVYDLTLYFIGKSSFLCQMLLQHPKNSHIREVKLAFPVTHWKKRDKLILAPLLTYKCSKIQSLNSNLRRHRGPPKGSHGRVFPSSPSYPLQSQPFNPEQVLRANSDKTSLAGSSLLWGANITAAISELLWIGASYPCFPPQTLHRTMEHTLSHQGWDYILPQWVFTLSSKLWHWKILSNENISSVRPKKRVACLNIMARGIHFSSRQREYEVKRN